MWCWALSSPRVLPRGAGPGGWGSQDTSFSLRSGTPGAQGVEEGLSEPRSRAGAATPQCPAPLPADSPSGPSTPTFLLCALGVLQQGAVDKGHDSILGKTGGTCRGWGALTVGVCGMVPVLVVPRETLLSSRKEPGGVAPVGLPKSRLPEGGTRSAGGGGRGHGAQTPRVTAETGRFCGAVMPARKRQAASVLPEITRRAWGTRPPGPDTPTAPRGFCILGVNWGNASSPWVLQPPWPLDTGEMGVTGGWRMKGCHRCQG